MPLKCCGREFAWVSVLIDVITLTPFIAWFFVSATAIPGYARIQWFGPVAGAIATVLIMLLATINMWRRTHVRATIYLVVEDDVNAPQATPPPTCDCAKCWRRPETWIALLCLVICVVWTVLCILANSAIPWETQPCGRGNCLACDVDPHCHEWARGVERDTALSNICPPRVHDEDSDSDLTFSCVADAAWMGLTAVFAGVWMLFLLRPPLPGILRSSTSSSSKVDSEMTGAKPYSE